jgi:DNA-binding transcriptional ArsR family regulator
MARNFSHPSMKDLTIDGILYALSDPIRRAIVAKLSNCESMSCAKSCAEGLSPSTISFHHKTLRENGLIRSEKRGVEVINTLRKDEIDKKFPGLLDSILRFHKS